MKALILAAGAGKRLQPVTEMIPKSMVEIGGKPLLLHTLDRLIEAGITEIGIAVGHMADYIRGKIGDSYLGARISYFENPRYDTTNNVVSLYTALDFCDDDMLMLECDVLFRREVLAALLSGEGECSILVSPYDPATMDGSVIVTGPDGTLELVLGRWQGGGFDYTSARKTVNLYKFTRKFTEKYMPLIRWYVEHMGEQSYYEKVLGSLMYLRECDVRTVEVPAEAWCEIDDAEDLCRARERFGGGDGE